MALILLVSLASAAWAADISVPIPEAVTDEQKKWYRYTDVTIAAIKKHNPVANRPAPKEMIKEILVNSPELLAYIKSEIYAHQRKDAVYVDEGKPTDELLSDPISAYPSGDDGWYRLTVNRDHGVSVRADSRYGTRYEWAGRITGTNYFIRIIDDNCIFSEDKYQTLSSKGNNAIVPGKYLWGSDELMASEKISLIDFIAERPGVVLLNLATTKYKIHAKGNGPLYGVPLYALGCFVGANTPGSSMYLPPDEMLAQKLTKIDEPESPWYDGKFGGSLQGTQDAPLPKFVPMASYREAHDMRASAHESSRQFVAETSRPGNYMRANVRNYTSDLRALADRMNAVSAFADWAQSVIVELEARRADKQADQTADNSSKATVDNMKSYIGSKARQIRAEAKDTLGTRRKEYAGKDTPLQTFARRLEKLPAYAQAMKGQTTTELLGQAFRALRPTSDYIADGYFTNTQQTMTEFMKTAEEGRIAFLKGRMHYANTVKDPEIIKTLQAEDAYHEARARQVLAADDPRRLDDKRGHAELAKAVDDAKRTYEQQRAAHPLPALPDELADSIQALSTGGLSHDTMTYKQLAELRGAE